MGRMFGSVRAILVRIVACSAIVAGLCSCSKPQYDTSSPQAALDSMYAMIEDGRPEMLGSLVYIQPRDISYDDGVTEASAIDNVTEKAGDMFGRLFRVAKKIRDEFPSDVETELATAGPSIKFDDNGLDISRFMADPFGLLDQQRSRISVEDLGDGTAAILIDNKPAFGVGLQMKDVDGHWKIDFPIELLQGYRPDTRQEWSVLASMMLSMENALKAFEKELDQGQFKSLQQASNRAGRLLGERVFVQVLIYRGMKDKTKEPSTTQKSA